ncbi:MAG TPA: hypothetical protein VEP90_08415 [Methylomirabilota bacterium]|jgi:hypothetical protein|nr:hypothetical protein [Methylomirabilota bacterium]
MMEFQKQRVSFKTDPVVVELSGEEKRWKHGPLLPNSIRCIISGPSNCGKTNLMLSLLFHPRGLRFENCYVYSKSLQQAKYQFLEKVLKGVKGIGHYFYSDREDVIPPNQVKPNSIMIFDDVATQKQDVIRDYFSMGRHAGVDSFYLCQSYAQIPKHLLRDNANLLFLFKQDETNMKHLYDDHVNTDMGFNQFRDLCYACWKSNKYGYLVVDRDSSLARGRYRRGLDEYIKLWKNE